MDTNDQSQFKTTSFSKMLCLQHFQPSGENCVVISKKVDIVEWNTLYIGHSCIKWTRNMLYCEKKHTFNMLQLNLNLQVDCLFPSFQVCCGLVAFLFGYNI